MSGNYITVRVGKVPGKLEDYTLNGARSVRDALAVAEIEDTEGYEIRVEGDPANLDTQLDDGDSVVLAKQVKGNK